jgi:hypothetical protein
MQIGMIEKDPGDLAEIERQFHVGFFGPTSSPAGWRATHRHGSFGRQLPDEILLWTALLRLARQRPIPSEVVLPASVMELHEFEHLPFTVRQQRPGEAVNWLPLLVAEAPPASPLQARFDELAAVWKRDTSRVSSLSEITHHHAYQAILRMGPQVIPLILVELRRQPLWWGPALERLTGENPVPPEDRGKPRRIAEHWLSWEKNRGPAVRT